MPEPSSSTHASKMDADATIPPDKRVQMLVEALKDAYKELIDTALKLSGVLLVVVGWFTSKSDPLPMLCSIRFLTEAALLFAAAGPFGLAYLYRELYRRAAGVRAELVRQGFNPWYYERFRITKPMVGWALFGQFTMVTGIFAAIFSSYVSHRAEICTKRWVALLWS